MKNKPARIGFYVLCVVLAILSFTHLITVIQSSALVIVGLFAFGLIRIFQERM